MRFMCVYDAGNRIRPGEEIFMTSQWSDTENPYDRADVHAPTWEELSQMHNLISASSMVIPGIPRSSASAWDTPPGAFAVYGTPQTRVCDWCGSTQRWENFTCTQCGGPR